MSKASTDGKSKIISLTLRELNNNIDKLTDLTTLCLVINI